MFEASFQFIFQIYFFYKISRLLDWLISSSKLQKIEKKVSLVSWPVFLNHFVCNSLLNSCVLYATRADRWRDWHCDITCLIFQIKCPVFFFVTASFLSFGGGVLQWNRKWYRQALFILWLNFFYYIFGCSITFFFCSLWYFFPCYFVFYFFFLSSHYLSNFYFRSIFFCHQLYIFFILSSHHYLHRYLCCL